MGKKFIIGDVRGELGLLKDLFDKISPVQGDSVLFLGSMIGPGSDSKGTLDFLVDLKRSNDRAYSFLWGCYEHLFQRVISRDKSVIPLWGSMNGEAILRSYSTEGKIIHLAGGNGQRAIRRVRLPITIPESHIWFFEHCLHLWYQDHEQKFVVSHAGFNPYTFLNPGLEECVFGVDKWWEHEWRIPDIDIIFGHVPLNFKIPYIKPGKIGIDLGCGLGGRLCAWEASTKTFYVAEKILAA